MKIHITCSQPSRSLVLAVHAARELLCSRGHEVGVSWPESWLEEGDFRRSGLNRKTLNDAELIVHVSAVEEVQLPSELTACLRFGTPVVVYDALSLEDSPPPGEATVRINRAEDLIGAVREACRLTIG